MLNNYIVGIVVTLGIVSLYWILHGLLLFPVRAGDNTELKLVLCVSGEANELENTLKGLIWLRENGTLKADIEIYASGPSISTRLVGEAFSRDYHYIFYNESGES